MTRKDALSWLRKFKRNAAGEEEVLNAFQRSPYKDLDFAKVDLQRGIRTGRSEVVFGPGKTPAQVVKIAAELDAERQAVLITRATPEQAKAVRRRFRRAEFHEAARCIILPGKADRVGIPGTIAVVSAGTSDLPVAEEAAVTAEFYLNNVDRTYDVGVAGIHRLLDQLENLRRANVVIVVAGMEGALPSVVAGLVSKPVIAVPTSVGYGASFHGLAALLGMLNSCGSGVTVVNIDNGFGAAFAATQINSLAMTHPAR